MNPLRAWRRWQAQRRHAGDEFAPLFQRYRGPQWVALDLETTGLDVEHDEILSLAAVRGDGNRILLRDRLDLRIRSASPRIKDAIRHHRLRPLDLAEGVTLEEALRRLFALVGGRPLVGYCIDFDLAMLDRACQRCFGFVLPQRRIDVRAEYARQFARRQPYATPDLRFETLAAALGVPVFERHTALGDALTAAAMHCALRGG